MHGGALRNQRPKVAYLAGAFPKRSETFVYREVRALRSRGWDVVCATLHPSDSPPEDSTDLAHDLLTVYSPALLAGAVRELVGRPLRSLSTLEQSCLDALSPEEPMSLGERAKLVAQASAALGLARCLRSRGVTHVHAHFAHAPATLAMYAAKQLGVGFSFTGHANDIFQRRSLLKKKLRRADFVASISHFHQDFYRTEQPSVNAQVVRCGVDTESWQPVSHDSTAAPPLRLVTLCRLVKKKGIDILIRALPLMERPVHLVVAGDGPETESLGRLCKELGCDDRVEWLGAVENDRAREVLQQAQVFVLPCRTDEKGDRDGIPVALMEAMACGLVVVSGDLPAVRELIAHESSGLLLQDGDPQKLAALLDRLATSDLGPLAQAGRSRVVDEFSLAQNIERLTTLFSEKEERAWA
jgi:glycosyltransferase involved in cell wall biosynthesis